MNLDQNLIEQLRGVFSALENPITLRVATSAHPAQEELLALLRDVATTSERIRIELSPTVSAAPRFELIRDSGPTGISFRGVPGGHEFSSLILSILYADGKAKQPDSGIQDRIRALRGPIRLKTYISLSCENCPEVVQALNLITALHSDFEHEMIDGAVSEDEVEALGIQGVPAVFSGETLIQSGKSSLTDLLSKLESVFGKSERPPGTLELGTFDVLVVGGGPAGVSAAIYSARKGLKTALIAERLGGQLQDTKGIENMISVPYTEGPALTAKLNEHAARYPIRIFEHRRVRSISGESLKRIHLDSGEFLSGSNVIIATGAKWRELGVPGERENIGRGVAFCAHCDGPFYREKRVAVVGGGNSGVEAAIDLAGIAKEVTLIEYGEKLRADDVLVAKLQALPNVSIITRAKTSRIMDDGTKVASLEFEDRASGETRQLGVDGIFVQIGLLPNSQFLQGIVELTPGGEIVVDAKGRTSQSGIYAAGDVTTIPFKQIVTAMGDGAKVALAAFEDRIRSRPG